MMRSSSRSSRSFTVSSVRALLRVIVHLLAVARASKSCRKRSKKLKTVGCENESSDSSCYGRIIVEALSEKERNFDRQWELIKDTSDGLKELYTKCRNKDDQCDRWQLQGACQNNPFYMQVHCRKSCGECEDYDVELGMDQAIDRGSDARFKTLEVFQKSVDYKKNEIVAHPEKYSFAIQKGCVNQDRMCSYWAALGECDANPSYMRTSCALACRSCSFLARRRDRCAPDPSERNVLAPGDLHRLFARLADPRGAFADYGPVVHSRPARVVGVDADGLAYGEHPVLDGPWIVSLERFLTNEEADRLVELGERVGFERSTGRGHRLMADGVTFESAPTESRTSSTAWCLDDDDVGCHDDPVVRRVTARVGNVTGVPEPYHEYPQLLKYEEGQFYQRHHDFVPYRQGGPRVLTFFLYLNDVEDGGQTKFRNFSHRRQGGISVTPKKGRALIWPSVVDNDLEMKDFRTAHEAAKVKSGVKYAANVWIRLRKFKPQSKLGCE